MGAVIEAAMQDGSNGYDVSDLVISEDIEVALRVLSDLAGEAVSSDELSAFVQDGDADMSPDDAVRFFTWADHMGVLYGAKGSYRLDTTCAEALSRAR